MFSLNRTKSINSGWIGLLILCAIITLLTYCLYDFNLLKDYFLFPLALATSFGAYFFQHVSTIKSLSMDNSGLSIGKANGVRCKYTWNQVEVVFYKRDWQRSHMLFIKERGSPFIPFRGFDGPEWERLINAIPFYCRIYKCTHRVDPEDEWNKLKNK